MKTITKAKPEEIEDEWLTGWWGIGVVTDNQDTQRFAIFYPKEPSEIAHVVLRADQTYILIENEAELMALRDILSVTHERIVLRDIHSGEQRGNGNK